MNTEIETTNNSIINPMLPNNCRCCGQNSGRYCGQTLKKACGGVASHCSKNIIYYCFSTESFSQIAKNCPVSKYGKDDSCQQIAEGSARCTWHSFANQLVSN